MRAFIVACALVLGETRLATGFAPAGGSARTGVVLRHSRAERPFASLRVAASAAAALPAPSPQSPLPAPSPSFAVGSKVLNLYSVFFLVLNVLSLCVAYPLLAVASAWSFLFDRKRRRAIDAVVALWARLCLTLFFFSRVRVEGAEHLPARGQPALFTPNHCSFLDIFALSGFLPRPLKYVSKVEILRIPLIGWAMQLAGHIALRRADRKSQLATFRDSVACLKDGNNLVTFPEGTRSPTGVLGQFKAGPFKMAATAGVPVVPISIVNTQYAMPVSSLLPIRRASGMRIVVHPPIATQGRDSADLCAEARAAVSSGLPEWMRSE